MDKLARYRASIKQLLTDRAHLMRSQPMPGEEILCLLDEATDNYLLVRLGWHNRKRLYSITLHLRLIECKIYVEQDWTDDFLSDLEAEGVARCDMVLAFTLPELRSSEDFALA